jgi:integrase
MAILKRGNFYWYEFTFKKQRVRVSTRQRKQSVARDMEAAHRKRLMDGERGIIDLHTVPTLREFGPRFTNEMEVHCKGKSRTLEFWKQKLDRLLEFEALASSKLDAINKALIADYVQTRKDDVAPATINRELATLRRLLYLALEWEVIKGVPRIKKLKGERNREFVLSHELEREYLAAAPEPLRDVALLILDTGLRVGEALALEWRDIHLDPAHGGRFGYLHVRDGKSKNARRNVSLTARVKDMLAERSSAARSTGIESQFVFPGRSENAFVVTSLCHQHATLRSDLNMPADFVIHSLRHTMLTRLGEAGADAFTLMRIAGHSSVTVSEKYVHPTPEGLERAFERLENFNRDARRPKLKIA